MSKELASLAREAAMGRLSRRAFLGRAAALGVGASMAGTLLAGAVRAAGPVRGGTLRAGMVGGEATDGLDPAQIDNQVKAAFTRCWGEKLLDPMPDGSLRPLLATEYGSSPDAKTWTFKIREGVSFHDGSELTAEDVRATIARHAGPDTRSGAFGLLHDIDTLAAENDEFIVTLKEPNAEFPFLISDYHLVIQPGGGVDNPEAGIGTGPYRITAHEPGVREIGERFDDYWAADERGHVDQVEILVIADATARTAALRAGQVHMINRVEPKLVALVEEFPGVGVRRITGSAHYVFAMQCITPPFDNNDLRLALKYAINRQEMLDKILFGFGALGNDMPINAAYPLFADDFEQREYDPDKAAFHYEKSGHEGPILFQTSEVAFPGAVDAAVLFQQSAAGAGITITIQREPGDGYWSQVWNVAPFSASYWLGRPTQDQQYSTAYVSTADWNETRFRDAHFDELLVRARGELDEGKRKLIYRDMGEIVRDEGGAIIPMFNAWLDGVSDAVQGFDPDPLGELMNNRAFAECWLNGA